MRSISGEHSGRTALFLSKKSKKMAVYPVGGDLPLGELLLTLPMRFYTALSLDDE